MGRGKRGRKKRKVARGAVYFSNPLVTFAAKKEGKELR